MLAVYDGFGAKQYLAKIVFFQIHGTVWVLFFARDIFMFTLLFFKTVRQQSGRKKLLLHVIVLRLLDNSRNLGGIILFLLLLHVILLRFFLFKRAK